MYVYVKGLCALCSVARVQSPSIWLSCVMSYYGYCMYMHAFNDHAIDVDTDGV